MKWNDLFFMVTSITKSVCWIWKNLWTQSFLLISQDTTLVWLSTWLQKAGTLLTVYLHGNWNQSGSPVDNKYPLCRIGGEKEVDSSLSQTSFDRHSYLLTLIPSWKLQGLGIRTEYGGSKDIDSLDHGSKVYFFINGAGMSKTPTLLQKSEFSIKGGVQKKLGPSKQQSSWFLLLWWDEKGG